MILVNVANPAEAREEYNRCVKDAKSFGILPPKYEDDTANGKGNNICKHSILLQCFSFIEILNYYYRIANGQH
jgi:hypothetical protein